ncbi:unnamed protein product [Protopolystoma xenopodis]|uniref:Uncharacterized protein n=1 Tax=Protopolystoma xenopodis TaxID=117903 RepID=A0A3S5FF56_9PLAT|nr:unnamed protein product [Protopolystoma xenopodis]
MTLAKICIKFPTTLKFLNSKRVILDGQIIFAAHGAIVPLIVMSHCDTLVHAPRRQQSQEDLRPCLLEDPWRPLEREKQTELGK